jgi:hypothetical protein
MLEIKMVIAMLCRNFEVAAADEAAPLEEVFSFTMRPARLSVALRARRRRDSLP